MADFQWLQMRITEEKERRERESMILERLPRASAELQSGLAACVQSYNAAFGAGAIEIESQPQRIRILVRDRHLGLWRDQSRIEVLSVPAIPGFQIDRAGSPLVIEVGMLPGDKLFYRDREKDQYLTMEELTRRILDRALFPKLGE
ncbi:MAG TPA: hypothetical protein VME43_16415 [Bryobacteraceae bacterium]|nr:hypothetical protein [Bryobacteraceae bacterium]